MFLIITFILYIILGLVLGIMGRRKIFYFSLAIPFIANGIIDYIEYTNPSSGGAPFIGVGFITYSIPGAFLMYIAFSFGKGKVEKPNNGNR